MELTQRRTKNGKISTMYVRQEKRVTQPAQLILLEKATCPNLIEIF
jgi:hypothetical protein